MSLSVDRVSSIRHVMLIAIRVMAFLLIVYGCYAFVRVIFVNQPWYGMRSLFMYFDEGNSLPAKTLGALGTGVVLALLSRRIVAWMVPLPRAECLGCGYRMTGSSGPICPECGAPLPSLESRPG